MKPRTFILLGVALLIGCASPTHNKNKEEAAARWEQMRAKVKFQLAERNFENGEVEEALKLCQEVIALHPEHLDAWVLMTRIQLEKGQAAEAEAALHAAAGLGQVTPELDYLRGMLAERREQMPEALDAFKRAYDARPGEADYLQAYVEAMLALDKMEAALELLLARQRDFEQDVRVQLLLGQALSLADRPREAGDVYLTIVRLEPNDPMIREEAGLVLLAGGRLNEARIVLEPLTRAQAKPSAVLLQTWAKALLDANDPRGAVHILEGATSRYPQAAGPWLLLGKAYLMLDQPSAAREAARQACDIQRESVDAKLMLAYSCLASGDREGASDAARQIIAVRPDDAEARLILQKARNPGVN